MAYITKEQVAEIRKEIKRVYPDFKWSVINRDYSEVVVTLVQGNGFKEYNGEYEQLNQFYLENYTQKVNEVFSKVMEIITEKAGYNSKVFEDADYGNIPNFYISLNIGKWDKKYIEITND